MAQPSPGVGTTPAERRISPASWATPVAHQEFWEDLEDGVEQSPAAHPPMLMPSADQSVRVFSILPRQTLRSPLQSITNIIASPRSAMKKPGSATATPGRIRFAELV